MRNLKIITLLLLLAALIPYLFTCFYALPFADDFCFGWTGSENISFTQKFLKQYLYWNGRYTSDVLVNLHPLTTGSILLYQLASFVAVIATPCVLYIFVRRWLSGNLVSIIVALFISVFYLCYLPNITEGVYWYIGLANYHWGVLCFVLQLSLLAQLLNHDKTNVLLWISSLLLLVISIGFNEVGASIIPIYYLSAFMYLKLHKSLNQNQDKVTRILLFHFIVAFIASVFVILSPGNFTRQHAFAARFNIPHSLWFSSLQTFRFIGNWALSAPFVALSLIVVTLADKTRASAIKKVDFKFIFLLLLFTVFISAFLPYMATGILGQHRTINYVFPFFIILWLATLLSFSEKYLLYKKLRPVLNDVRIFALIVIAIIVMFFSGNCINILKDIKSDVFSRYNNQFMQRQSAILQQPTAAISPLKNIPKTFRVVDVKGDTTWWADKCMKRFYTETNIVLR